MSNGVIPTGPTNDARILLRVLNVLLWGLPLVLLMSVPGAMSQWFHMFFLLVVQDFVTRGFWLLDMIPTLGSMALLGYGIFLLGRIKPDDENWQTSLFQGRLVIILLTGMAPFLMWRNWVPNEPVFLFGCQLFAFVGCVFIIHLNFLLHRLSSFLPSPVLESDTRMFARLNLILLTLVLIVVIIYLVSSRMQLFVTSDFLDNILQAIDEQSGLLLMLLVLPSVSTTMSMLWKTRQTVMTMVFEPEALQMPSLAITLDKNIESSNKEELEQSGDEDSEQDEPVSSPDDTSCPSDEVHSQDRE